MPAEAENSTNLTARQTSFFFCIVVTPSASNICGRRPSAGALRRSGRGQPSPPSASTCSAEMAAFVGQQTQRLTVARIFRRDCRADPRHEDGRGVAQCSRNTVSPSAPRTASSRRSSAPYRPAARAAVLQRRERQQRVSRHKAGVRVRMPDLASMDSCCAAGRTASAWSVRASSGGRASRAAWPAASPLRGRARR